MNSYVRVIRREQDIRICIIRKKDKRLFTESLGLLFFQPLGNLYQCFPDISFKLHLTLIHGRANPVHLETYYSSKCQDHQSDNEIPLKGFHIVKIAIIGACV
jgi:hypothetical protein